MAKYICTRKCFWQIRLYEEGEILNWAGDTEPPHHFKKVNGDITITENKKTETTEDEEDKNIIESLRAEHEAIGSAYDRRWGKTKLEHALIIAKKERGL